MTTHHCTSNPCPICHPMTAATAALPYAHSTKAISADNMTDLRTRAGQVVERLRLPIPYTVPPGMRVINPATINPDGPEAAAIIEALLAELDARADAERDRVVKWLRAHECILFVPDGMEEPFDEAADAIAANEHRSEP